MNTKTLTATLLLLVATTIASTPTATADDGLHCEPYIKIDDDERDVLIRCDTYWCGVSWFGTLLPPPSEFIYTRCTEAILEEAQDLAMQPVHDAIRVVGENVLCELDSYCQAAIGVTCIGYREHPDPHFNIILACRDPPIGNYTTEVKT